MRSKATRGFGGSLTAADLFLRFLRVRTGTKGVSYAKDDISGRGVMTANGSCTAPFDYYNGRRVTEERAGDER